MLSIAICDDEKEIIKLVNAILSNYCEKRFINYQIY